MADTALIDLMSHVSNTAASTGNAKSSVNNFAKSSNFADIFNSANKTYSANTTSSNNQYKTVNTQTPHTIKNSNNTSTAKNTTPTTTTDKSNGANTVNRKDSESRNHSQNDSKNISKNSSQGSSPKSSSTDNGAKVTDNTTNNDTKTSDNNTANATDTADTTNNTTDNTATVDTTAQEKVVADNIENAQAALQAATEEISVPIEQIATNTVETTESIEDSKNISDATATKAVTDITTNITTDASTVKKDSQLTQNDSDATDLPKVDPSLTTDNIINILAQNTPIVDLTNNIASTSNVEPAQNPQDEQITKVVQPNLSVSLSDSTKILNNLANQANVVKNQTIPQATVQVSAQSTVQAQQALSDTTSQGQQTVQTATIATPAIQEVDTQVPVIAVNTEELASTVNVKTDSTDVNAKQNVKNILDKTSLTQEALDKTNAKIVNVENSNLSDANLNANSHSNSNNLANKQNTADQVAKLAVENNSTTTSTANVNTVTNLSGITTDATSQTNFEKPLSNVQAQPQQQSPKEISDSEILSQVNNKLNSFKDDGTSKVSIVLRPENLGKINLELVNTKEGLTAQLTTDNPQVKQILDKSIDSLKDTLSSQGVGVSSVTVKVDETQKQSNDMYSFDREQSNAGNQGSSNNAQNQNQNKNEFSFDEEIDNVIATTNSETGTVTENENLVSAGSYAGNVDYKV